MNTIKRGATFSVSIQLTDSATKKPIRITPDTLFEGKIKDNNDRLLSVTNITVPDQSTAEGFVIISVPATETKNWPLTEAFLDIKLTIADTVLKTETVKFLIEKDITE